AVFLLFKRFIANLVSFANRNGLYLFKRREIFSNILIFNKKYNNCYKITLFKGILYQTRQKGESGVGRNTSKYLCVGSKRHMYCPINRFGIGRGFGIV